MKAKHKETTQGEWTLWKKHNKGYGGLEREKQEKVK